MRRNGLVTRERLPENRRVELTAEGERMFLKLRDAAAAFDRRMRAGL